MLDTTQKYRRSFCFSIFLPKLTLLFSQRLTNRDGGIYKRKSEKVKVLKLTYTHIFLFVWLDLVIANHFKIRD